MGSIDSNLDTLFKNLLVNIHDEPRVSHLPFTPYNWLETAKIYNQKLIQVPSNWIVENADIIIVLFSINGADRDKIILKFQEIYENAKHINLPVEVLNVPLVEMPEDAAANFESQANWFTLLFNDPLSHELKFMYGISCVPCIYVLKPNCEVISYNGIEDLDVYGKNAMISWMSVSPVARHERRMSKDALYYGSSWKYLQTEIKKHDYHKYAQGESNETKDVQLRSNPKLFECLSVDSTQKIIQGVTADTARNVPQIVSPNQMTTISEEQLKDEGKD